MKPAPKALPPTPATKPKDEPWTLKPPRVFGFIQAFYRYAFETGDDGVVDYDNFRVQRARVGVKGEVLPRVSYDIEIDPRAPEVSGILRDAFIGFHVIPRHELRFGQQKTQFGYENVESSTKLWAVNRTEVSDNLSRGLTLRDIGIGLIGNIKLGGGFRIEDAITVVNGAGLNVQADDTRKKNIWGRAGLRYSDKPAAKPADWLLRFGVSGATGDFIDEGDDAVDPADDFRLEFKRVGTDLEVDHPWFFVSAEYVRGWDENTSDGETETLDGYYVNLVGKTPWQVGPIARYDTLGDEFRRWTLGAYYGLPRSPLRLLFNYELRLVKDDVRGDDKLYVWAQVKF